MSAQEFAQGIFQKFAKIIFKDIYATVSLVEKFLRYRSKLKQIDIIYGGIPHNKKI